MQEDIFNDSMYVFKNRKNKSMVIEVRIEIRFTFERAATKKGI